jgi:hypothetical protein
MGSRVALSIASCLTLGIYTSCGRVGYRGAHLDATGPDASSGIDATFPFDVPFPLDVPPSDGPFPLDAPFPLDVPLLLDAPLPIDAGPPVPVSIADLEVRWVTATTVRLGFRVTAGEAAALERYEVEVAGTAAELAAGAGTVLGPAEVPDLAFFDRPDAAERVEGFTLTGLSPGTMLAIRLRAVNRVGAPSVSAAVTATTSPAPMDALVLYEGPGDGGYSIPAELVETADGGLESGACLRFTPACADRCFENLRRQGIGVPLSSSIDLARAFLEISVSYPASRPAFWANVRLWLDGGAPDRLFQTGSLVVPTTAPGAFVTMEVPLTSLRNASRAIEASDLATSVHEWTLGASWESGVEVRVDRVRVRW